MKILITGINGFAGSHLAKYCLSQGDKVFGTIRSPNTKLDNLMPNLIYKVKLIQCELTDYKNVLSVIKTVKPNLIFHLAGQSFVPKSWDSPADTITNNAVAQINVLEAVRGIGLDIKIQIACSSEQYGLVYPNELPIKETNPLRPLSPYGVSKATQEMLAWQYFKNYKMKIVITRAFNHEGPRRGIQFMTANFAYQIAKAKEKDKILVGNLEAIRDFTDVRDTVKGYYLSLTCKKIKFGTPYNICSGKGVKIADVLNKLIAISGKKIKPIKDSSRMRPSDVPVLIGDFTRFHQATGWKPEISLDKTLRDIYQDEYNKIQRLR